MSDTDTTHRTREFHSFAEFYPFYLSEHSNDTSRRLHYIGSTLVLLILLWAFVSGNFWWLLVLPVAGYGFAWVGHFFFEKNRPATFKYPLWSLMGDFRLFYETVSGRRRF